MKTIYLHIGVGKTGTTSIQQFLAANHEDLSAAGMNYVLAGGGAAGGGHQNFAKSFITDIPHYMVPPTNIISDRALILHEIEHCHESKILLSSENFPLSDPCLVRDFFERSRMNFKYKIVMFIRSQDELVESEYNQLVKVRLEKRTLVEYIETEFDGDFMKLASKWEQVFGQDNLICRIYDSRHFNVVNDFLGCLEVVLNSDMNEKYVAPVVSNKSLGFLALTLKHALNMLQPHTGDKLNFELPSELSMLIPDIDLPAILMNSRDARQFLDRYRESNRKFSERFLGESMSDIGGRRYSDYERDDYYHQCQNLINL